MLVRLDSARLTISDAPLVFAERNRGAIAAHWDLVVPHDQRLWNGPQFLFTDVSCAGGVLSATGHRTDYAAFLYWRDHKRDGTATHIAGSSLPVTTDGAIVAARMAAHTSNAGRLYFPAGALDPDDVRDGVIDITASIRRELAEETGLAPSKAAFDPFMVAARGDHAWFVARRCRLDLTFDACVAQMRAHQAETGDDELAELVAIRAPREAEMLVPYARALALWHLDQT